MVQPKIGIDRTGRRIRILMDLAGLSIKGETELQAKRRKIEEEKKKELRYSEKDSDTV